MKPVKLQPTAPRSQVKHSTNEPLHSLFICRLKIFSYHNSHGPFILWNEINSAILVEGIVWNISVKLF